MSLYGRGKYGTGIYGPGGAVVTYTYSGSLSVRSTGYGQLLLTWSIPTPQNWRSLVIVRNSYGYAVDSDDGITVFQSATGTPQEYTDTDLTQGREYYYSMFVLDPSSNVWHLAGQARGLSVKDFNTYSIMWYHLPMALRSASRNVLDVASENKDFSDFIRLLAFEYDYQKTQAYLVRRIYVPSDTPQSLLPALMNMFGLEYEKNISDSRMRVLLKNAVSLYQAKGSTAGIRNFVKAFSGYDASVSQDGVDPDKINILVEPNRVNTLTNPNFTVDYSGWSTTNTSSIEIVDTTGTNPHVTVNGSAIELYPSGTSQVSLTAGTSPTLPVTGGEYYTFSIYATTGNYGTATSADDELHTSIEWRDSSSATISTVSGDSMRIRRELSLTWYATRAVLDAGDIGIESDTMKFKVGDGVKEWSLLPYASTSIDYIYHLAADWSGATVLGYGTIGVESDTFKFKIGDGVTSWSALTYTTSLPAWIRPYTAALAPDNAAYAVVSLKWTPANADMAVVCDEALFAKEYGLAAFFDGSSGYEDISGLMWTGTDNASSSAYYRNYDTTLARLNAVLPEWTPAGSTYSITPNI